MRFALIFVVVAIAGCKQIPMLPTLTPYKVDVQQGNQVTQDMVEKLKPGMTRSQVRFLLGTPLVVDPFRNDRWDYVYLYYKGGQLIEQRRISILFEADKLKRVDGDVVAAGADAAKKDAGAQSSVPAALKPPPAASDAKPGVAPAAPVAPTPAAKAE
jgi:outer membrane protein assembly factor BamE